MSPVVVWLAATRKFDSVWTNIYLWGKTGGSVRVGENTSKMRGGTNVLHEFNPFLPRNGDRGSIDAPRSL